MKICLLLDALGIGGIEQVAVTTAVQLVRMGHDVSVACYYATNCFSEQLRSSGVKVYLKSARWINRIIWLRFILRQGNFHIIHALKPPALIWGLFATSGLRTSACWLGGYHALTREPFAIRLLCRFLSPHVATWIVPSTLTVRIVRDDFTSPGAVISVVPNPIKFVGHRASIDKAAAKVKLGISEAEPVVSMVANLLPWKNHQMLLRAAVLLKSSGYCPLILLAGRDGMLGRLEEEAARLGVVDRIRFLGAVQDVRMIYEATDIAVMTSFHESFCLSLAEAGAFAIACVTSDNGGANEFIKHGESGYIVPSDDAASMARCLQSLLSDQNLRKKLGEALRSTVEGRFAPAQTTALLLSQYADAYKRAANSTITSSAPN